MFIKNVMIPKSHCYVVQKDDSLEVALNLLDKEDLEGVPVLDGNHYVGTVTRFKIYHHYFQFGTDPKQFLAERTCGDFASTTIPPVTEEAIFESAIFQFKHFPLIAVVDDTQKFLGIVTRHDVLSQLESSFGLNVSGIRIMLSIVETKGRLARLAEIVSSFYEQIISIVLLDETDKLVRRIVLKIEKTEKTESHLDKLLKKLETEGFRILHISED